MVFKQRKELVKGDVHYSWRKKSLHPEEDHCIFPRFGCLAGQWRKDCRAWIEWWRGSQRLESRIEDQQNDRRWMERPRVPSQRRLDRYSYRRLSVAESLVAASSPRSLCWSGAFRCMSRLCGQLLATSSYQAHIMTLFSFCGEGIVIWETQTCIFGADSHLKLRPCPLWPNSPPTSRTICLWQRRLLGGIEREVQSNAKTFPFRQSQRLSQWKREIVTPD